MSNITTQDAKTIFSVYKSNLGGAGDTEFLQWVNFINQFLYEKFANINPDQYLIDQYIKTITNIESYKLPSDFQTLKIGGIYKIKQGNIYGALNFDAQTANFAINETTTGSTSTASGKNAYITNYGDFGTLIMTDIDQDPNSFEDNELLTDTGGGNAIANGTLILFDKSDKMLSVTKFGDDAKGYWLDKININFTPVPTTSEVFIVRYLPLLSDLTSITQETIIPLRFKQFLRNAIELFWSQWRQDSNNEFLASQRFISALDDMYEEIEDTTKIISFESNRNFYS